MERIGKAQPGPKAPHREVQRKGKPKRA
jgi:hypothetical protein